MRSSWLAQPYPWPLPCEPSFLRRELGSSWPRRSPSSCRGGPSWRRRSARPCPRLRRAACGTCAVAPRPRRGQRRFDWKVAGSDGTRRADPWRARRVDAFAARALCVLTARGALSGTFRHGRGVARAGAALHLALRLFEERGGRLGVDLVERGARGVRGASCVGETGETTRRGCCRRREHAAPAVTASSASSCLVDVSWDFSPSASTRRRCELIDEPIERSPLACEEERLAFRAINKDRDFLAIRCRWTTTTISDEDLTRDLVTVAEAASLRFLLFACVCKMLGQIWRATSITLVGAHKRAKRLGPRERGAGDRRAERSLESAPRLEPWRRSVGPPWRRRSRRRRAVRARARASRASAGGGWRGSYPARSRRRRERGWE